MGYYVSVAMRRSLIISVLLGSCLLQFARTVDSMNYETYSGEKADHVANSQENAANANILTEVSTVSKYELLSTGYIRTEFEDKHNVQIPVVLKKVTEMFHGLMRDEFVISMSAPPLDHKISTNLRWFFDVPFRKCFFDQDESNNADGELECAVYNCEMKVDVVSDERSTKLLFTIRNLKPDKSISYRYQLDKSEIVPEIQRTIDRACEISWYSVFDDESDMLAKKGYLEEFVKAVNEVTIDVNDHVVKFKKSFRNLLTLLIWKVPLGNTVDVCLCLQFLPA
eukprot:119924_1